MLFATTMAGNLLSVAYTFVMARVLGPAHYASLVALLSLFTVLGLPGGTIQTVVARFVAVAEGRGDQARIRQIVLGLLRPLAPLALLATVALAAASPLLAGYLRISDLVPLLLFAPLFGLQLLLPVLRGALQGLQRFGLMSAVMFLEIAFKVFLGVGLAWWGLGVGGALAAMLAGAAVSLAVAGLAVAPLLRGAAPGAGAAEHSLGEVWRYSVPTLLTLGGLSCMVTLDAVLVKHYFAEGPAGAFAAVSVAGRSLYWASTAVTLALLPFVAHRAGGAGGASVTGGDAGSRRALWYSLAIVGLLAAAGEAVFLAAPQLVVGLLFSARYAEGAPLLALYGLGAACLALANVALFYLLGIGDVLVGPLALACAAIQVVLVVLFHQDLRQVVVVLVAADAALMLASLLRATAAGRGGHRTPQSAPSA